MKKVEWSKSDIINQYIKSGNVMCKATLEGDYNKEGKKITQVSKYLGNH